MGTREPAWLRLARAVIAERVVVTAVLLGTTAVFALGFTTPDTAAHTWLMALDVVVVAYFLVEQLLRMRIDGWRTYWESRWNRFDLLVVLLSLPVLVTPVVETSAFASAPILRVARLFRLFRLLRFIPDREHLAAGIRRAIRASVGVFLGIAIVNFIFAMGAHMLFANNAPELFGNPIRACYSMFRIFTIEGWYDIPEAIALHSNAGWSAFARIYFGVAVLVGGILGLSLGNAVFVDQMMADNNDEVERDVLQMSREVSLLREEIRELRTLLAAQNRGRGITAPGTDTHDPEQVSEAS